MPKLLSGMVFPDEPEERQQEDHARRKAAEAEPRTISNVTMLSTRRSRFPKP